MPLWVFGYGSLIWNPGFASVERQIARLAGWRRSFCMLSIHHRGSEAAPGLVLALDAAPEAHCDGVAFRVDETERVATLAYLRERELVSSAYVEIEQRVVLADGRHVTALTYVVDRDHRQYCGGLGVDEQVRIIAQARGGRGPNYDYLFQTAAHLADLGIEDPGLSDLAARVRARLG